MLLDWSNYFFGLTFAIAQKSKDPHTKNGCILVDGDNRILSVGYNGYPAGMPDEELPTTRPEKYPLMVHAEHNAVLNCRHRPVDYIKAYITGPPCSACCVALYQFNVREMYVANRPSKMFTEESKAWLDDFVEKSQRSTKGVLTINYVVPDLEWLREIRI